MAREKSIASTYFWFNLQERSSFSVANKAMKKLLFSFVLLLITSTLWAQNPEKGNYLMMRGCQSLNGSYIFQKSRNVYFDYNALSKQAPYKGKGSKKMVKDLFDAAQKVNFSKYKSVSGSDSVDVSEYIYLEYANGAKTHRICFDGSNEKNKELYELVGMMGSFW
jgi:hypothetical protein